ncbi:uncharacterized protein [Chironomus tepperi]|uniref:uncharacterized protein n=1 Tax=Chironomus tepperi TaxID=113505 RepID=UPI00391F5A02
MEANKLISILSVSLVILFSHELVNGQDPLVPSTIPVEWGNLNTTRLLAQQRFYNYPAPGFFAIGNGSMSISNVILGMKLIRLNGTDGLHTLNGGGVNHDFVNFDFMGVGFGRGYDFNVELYGGAAIKGLSGIILGLSFLLCCIFYY